MAIAAVSMCVMAACGSKDGSKQKEGTEQVAEGSEADSEAVAGGSEADSEAVAGGSEADPKAEEIVAMIKGIYDDVDMAYSTSGEDDDEDQFDLITKFGSKRLLDLVEKVRKIDAGKDEADHFIADWNWLICCWDVGVSRPEDIEATVDGNKARVKYWLYYSSQYALYDMALVYEDGKWRIDDILQIANDVGSKVEQMNKYIKDNNSQLTCRYPHPYIGLGLRRHSPPM